MFGAAYNKTHQFAPSAPDDLAAAAVLRRYSS
mgnify:CR=1 FL=1